MLLSMLLQMDRTPKNITFSRNLYKSRNKINRNKCNRIEFSRYKKLQEDKHTRHTNKKEQRHKGNNKVSLRKRRKEK